MFKIKGVFMKINKNFLVLATFFFVALVASFIKLSPVLGSYKLLFSGINFLMPILGAFIKPLFLPFTFVFFLLKKMTLGGALTLGIPTFMATLVVAVANKNTFKYKIYDILLRVIFPLFAIVLFVLNPVGNQAALYSFYWFVPVVLFFAEKILNKKYIFTTTLSATFIAHSVGSLIWLYTLNTTSTYWLSLIPVVAIERFVFAIGMSLSFIFINKIISSKFLFMFTKNIKCSLKLN